VAAKPFDITNGHTMARHRTNQMRLGTSSLCILCVGLVIVLHSAAALVAAEPIVESPRTLIWDGAHLAAIRSGKESDDPQYTEVLQRLRKNAEISRKRGPYSVMDKAEAAPSGDQHDYVSYARYWWPTMEKPTKRCWPRATA
jgi:hypothetical protein